MEEPTTQHYHSGASQRSRFTFGGSQWRTPFLFLLLPSDLVLFLWHSESGWTFLWALHCLLLCLLSVPHLPPDHPQPPVLAPPLRYYLRGPHQRHHAFRGSNGNNGAALPSGPEAAVRHSAGTPLSPSSTPAQGLTNHVQPRVTDGSASPSRPGSPAPLACSVQTILSSQPC
ncbi:hypothetical protein INR49_025722 [Caranx melampygus]|nr:hypothetical protein INR49_025722 [Caranx melampygus]